MSSLNEKKKVRELAEILDLDVSKVKSRLRELGIFVSSSETEIDGGDVQRLYKHVGFDPAAAAARKTAEEENADGKAGPKQGAAPEGVIRRVRRVVVEDAPVSVEKKTKQRGGVAGTADSNLRSGFVTVTDGDKYEEMDMRARASAAKKTAKDKAEEPKIQEPVTPAGERPKIRRKAAGSPGPEIKEVGGRNADTGNADTKAAESGAGSGKTAGEPVKTDGSAGDTAVTSAGDGKDGKAASAGKDGAGTKDGTDGESSDGKAASAGKDGADGSAEGKEETDGKDGRSASADGSSADADGRENAGEGTGAHPAHSTASGRPIVKRKSKEEIDAEKQQKAARAGASGASGADRNAQGQKAGDRSGKPDFDRNKPQTGGRPQQPGGQSGFRPSKGDQPQIAQPAQNQRRDSGRDKDFAKNEKKNEGNRRSGSTGGQQKEGKYNDARRMIGQKGSVSYVESDEFSYTNNYIDEFGQDRKKNPKAKKKSAQDTAARIAAQRLTNVKIPPVITVAEFASLIKKSATEVVGKLFMSGVIVTQNQEIDFDTAAIIADGYGIAAEPEIVVSNEELLLEDPDDLEPGEDAAPRPPVVVVMGHVDHGKTSLLDAIRNTSVTAGEAGGITQHIGAYTVTINDHRITFLDTPGHEAFTAMRARGAQVTDVAIIVVAADDGVMPQTIEAINHAKAAGVSIVVAVNKIDKEGANIDRVKNEMSEQGIVCEDWGGDVPFVPVSAKQGTNIDDLLETVILSADILELKASPTKQCKGTVIEAKLDKNKGPVATLLVQRGTLASGDAILTETTFGHIRRMTDDKGRTIKEAGPSTPVEVTGLPEVPEAGKVFYVVNKDERLAKKVADERIAKNRETTMSYSNKVTLEDLFSQIKAGEIKNLDIIVKGDVKGSVEAVKGSLEKLSNDEIRVRVIHGAVGGISESDVLLAEASNAVIIGFNVRPIGNVGEMAKEKGVDVKLYRIIYDAINDVKAAMLGMLKPEFRESVIGHVEIRKIFKISGVGTIAGGYVLNGKIVRNSEARIVRDGIVIYEGKLASLKRFKDDVKEVASGYECGLSFEKFDDLKEGDVIESYVMEQIERTL